MYAKKKMDVVLEGLEEIVEGELTQELLTSLKSASKEELIDLRRNLKTILHFTR